MKIIIEKYVCDACGKEVNATDRHYMINLGSSENWTGEAKISDDHIQKDLCHDCYKTIMQLIGVKPAVEEQIPANEVRGGRTQSYDKEIIKELWARGLTHRQIADRLCLNVHQVSYVVGRLTEEEKTALLDKYSAHKNVIQEEINSIGMKIVTDAEGFVISVE